MEWALEAYFPETARFLEAYTPVECQLGRKHPRPWLGGEDYYFWKAVQESGVVLYEGENPGVICVPVCVHV